MRACLKGTKANSTGRWYSLTKSVAEFDVSKLYLTIIQHVEIPNIISHGYLIREYMDLKPNKGEDIFLFFTRLDEMVERVERINHTCPQGLSIAFPEWIERWKIIDSTYGMPVFRAYYDRLLTESPQEWSMLTKLNLVSGLRVAMDNRQVLQPVAVTVHSGHGSSNSG